MVQLFRDLDGICGDAPDAAASGYKGVQGDTDISAGAGIVSGREDWEIAFELRINRAKYIRIYADVLVITEDRVFSLEFKMKDRIDPEEVSQAAKYSGYLEVLFGPDYDVIPALVLTRAEDLYTTAVLSGSTAEVPVCSGDMLFNLFDEYLRFLAP